MTLWGHLIDLIGQLEGMKSVIRDVSLCKSNRLTIDAIIYSLQKHGGISVYANELLRRLVRDNADVGVLSYGGPLPVALAQSATVMPVRKLERYRNLRLQHATIFHSTYYRTAVGNGVRNVTTVYDFTYELFASGPRRWVHSAQKFAAIRKSDAIICISENTKRDLHRFLPDVPERRIVVVPNGVSESYFPLDGLASTGAPKVLFVGVRAGYKNFESVVRALSLRPEYMLLAVGGGAFTADENALLRDLIPERYSHAGLVTDEVLNALYNQAYCLVYPSAYEGGGIPVLEAMRAGCPVIASHSSSIPEVAGSAAILLEAASPEGIAGALDALQAPAYRNQLRASGFLQAAQFSWETTYQRTREVYDSLV